MAITSYKTKYVPENNAEETYLIEGSLPLVDAHKTQLDKAVKTKTPQIIDDDENESELGLYNLEIIQRSIVPESHRRIADNYMIIRKIFGFSVVQSQITRQEMEILKKCGMFDLKITSAGQMTKELVLLRRWAESADRKLHLLSANIINIRTKELKYLVANYSVGIRFAGCRVFEKYLEKISKYRTE